MTLAGNRSRITRATDAHPGQDGVQVIYRAVDILWALRAHPEGLSLPEIAREVGLARPTVHRIVSTLEAVGFVLPMPGGRVRLGVALSILGAAANTRLEAELRPYLEALSQAVNESVVLAVLHGDRLVCAGFVASPQSLQAVTATGAPVPLHCTAVGKALLAELSPPEFARLIPERLPSLTSHTIASRELLLKEVEGIKAAGVAYDVEEYEVGLCGVGVAAPSLHGTQASFGILVPSVRFYGNEERLAAELRKTCDLVRQRFGATNGDGTETWQR
jgi:DNA-binding IclR family transcriptional regulator